MSRLAPSASATSFRVLLTDYAWADVEIERSILNAGGAELIVAPNGEESTLRELAKDSDAIMTCWAQVTAAVMAAAPRCRIIARLGVGLDNIDVAEATRRRILVTNVPDYCRIEVAEHALAMILSLGRHVAYYHAAARQGIYERQQSPPLQRLEGQSLGIVGLGSIGGTLAKKALALGFRVLAVEHRTHPKIDGVEFVSLDALLAESDYISLHAPLTAETHHLIGATQLARMKPTAFLINTARGGLIDHDALAQALAAGRLAGAALDVQEPEPPDLSRPPFNDPRIIVTPHIAFISSQSLADLRARAARQVIACLTGGRPENIVNPAVST